MLLTIADFSVAFRRQDGATGRNSVSPLHGLNLSLKRGEIVALIGVSGAGKSLLAHALFGILPPNAVTTGEIKFDGVVLDQTTWPDYRGRRMALVPQSISHLDPLARCDRQLAWAAQRSGRKLDRSARNAIFGHFGLDAAAAHAFPHELSGGMARRMMLAMGTIGQPDLIVADETTSGLDVDTARGVLRHLRALANQGKAVLLISHDLSLALPVADRVALLRDGQLVGLEAAKAFVDDGAQLNSDYARALWRALPENAFATEATTHA